MAGWRDVQTQDFLGWLTINFGFGVSPLAKVIGWCGNRRVRQISAAARFRGKAGTLEISDNFAQLRHSNFLFQTSSIRRSDVTTRL
jgi:hypothetical protein